MSDWTLRIVWLLWFPLVISSLLFFCWCCTEVRRISLTPDFSVCQSAQQLSIVYHVTVSKRLQQRWKSHLTSFFFLFFLWCSDSPSCDRSTICDPPCGLPPRFTVPGTLTDIKLSESSTPAGTPSQSANDPVYLRSYQLRGVISSPTSFPWHFPHFIVIALPLVCFLRDLNSLEGEGQLNFYCRSVPLVGK